MCSERKEEADETLEQECRLFEAERNATWPQNTSLQEKLYGSREELERTTCFTPTVGLQV